ncbi:MAG: nickel-dependent lactate racemase [Sphaerochaetaceae bacterium]
MMKELVIPKGIETRVVEPKKEEGESLPSLVDTASFTSWLKEKGRILVIVNDVTRPTPTSLILSSLVPVLQEKQCKLVILVATGSHRLPTTEDYHALLGFLYDDLRPFCQGHDAKDYESLTFFGKTSRGTPVFINKLVKDVDQVIITGSVEPHYFAGFTGGRKAFFPGVAGYETIEANHRLALEEGAEALKLEGNPVHEDLMECYARLLPLDVYSVMVVQGEKQKVLQSFSGEGMDEVFRRAVAKAKEVFSIPVGKKWDIVISHAAYPMDINLYQSQKALENMSGAVADGGVIILDSACREGLGSDAFAKILFCAKTPEEAITTIRKGYKLGYHKASRIAQLAKRVRIFAVTGLDSQTTESLFMKKYLTIQEALDAAIASYHDRKPSVLVVPDGCVTIPDGSRDA